MPVGTAIAVTVVAEQHDVLGAVPMSECDRAGTAVQEAVCARLGYAWNGSLRGGEALAREGLPHFGQVMAPPGAVDREQCVCPWRYLEAGVGDDDASASGSSGLVCGSFATGLSSCFVCLVFEPPRADRFDLFPGEAGPAGDADDVSPAGVSGRSVMIRTKPALRRLSASCLEHSNRSCFFLDP